MIKNKLFLMFGLFCSSLAIARSAVVAKGVSSVDKTMSHIRQIAELHARHKIPFDVGNALYNIHKQHKKNDSSKSALVGHLISDYGPYMLADDLQELYDYLAGKRNFEQLSAFQQHASLMKPAKKKKQVTL